MYCVSQSISLYLPINDPIFYFSTKENEKLLICQSKTVPNRKSEKSATVCLIVNTQMQHILDRMRGERNLWRLIMKCLRD